MRRFFSKQIQIPAWLFYGLILLLWMYIGRSMFERIIYTWPMNRCAERAEQYGVAECQIGGARVIIRSEHQHTLDQELI
jgi:hypothetical protein